MYFESNVCLQNSFDYIKVKGSFRFNTDCIESGVNNYLSDNVKKFKEFVKQLFSESFKKVSYVCDKIHKAVIVKTTNGIFRFEISTESFLIEPKNEYQKDMLKSLFDSKGLCYEIIGDNKFFRVCAKEIL